MSKNQIMLVKLTDFTLCARSVTLAREPSSLYNYSSNIKSKPPTVSFPLIKFFCEKSKKVKLNSFKFLSNIYRLLVYRSDSQLSQGNNSTVMKCRVFGKHMRRVHLKTLTQKNVGTLSFLLSFFSEFGYVTVFFYVPDFFYVFLKNQGKNDRVPTFF